MNKYDDIINLPHFVSKDRKHMSNHDRAAQFSPFDALTGYSQKIREAARLTDDLIEISEDEKEILNQKLLIIDEFIKDQPIISILYFIPDKYKDGGAYKSETISLKKIDLNKRLLISTDNNKYDLDYIIDINCDITDRMIE